MNIAQEILTDLKKQGYRVQDIAVQVGVTRAQLYNILKGDFRASPDLTDRLIESYGYRVELIKPSTDLALRR